MTKSPAFRLKDVQLAQYLLIQHIFLEEVRGRLVQDKQTGGRINYCLGVNAICGSSIAVTAE